MNLNKNKLIKIVIPVIAIIAIIGISYSLFSEVITGERKYVITSNNLKVYLDESKNLSDILGKYVVPVPDYQGLQNDSYTFSIVNDEVTSMNYSIYLVMDEDNTTPSDDIRYNLNNKELNLNKTANIDENIDSTGKLLYTGSIYSNSSQEFKLKLWVGLDAGNEYKGTNFSAHILVTAVQNVSNIYVDNVLNGTDPVIGEGMVPVKISDTGVVTKANLYEPWYDYSNSIWANAVILEDNYDTYKDGDTIPEEAIESYFVWIPRYRYKIFDEGNYTTLTSKENAEQEIEIVFENKTTPVSTGSTLGTWLTHPAFTSFDSDGMWVGKFESGYRGATSTEGAQQDVSDASKLIIKPNVYSWRNVTVGNSFKTSYDYNRELDSHMMKNTEWGAVAYLSHSKYGHIGSVRVNNNSTYITGYSGVQEPTLGYNGSTIEGNRIEETSLSIDGLYTINYLNLNSVVASTTNNYSGVYDMSGGSFEYVMGKSNGSEDSSKITNFINDFFTNSKWNKYYDKYVSTSITDFASRILGDATGEMGPFFYEVDIYKYPKSSWYGDRAHFAFSTDSWFVRGCSFLFGTTSGIFAFQSATGDNSSSCTFRVVLTPQ